VFIWYFLGICGAFDRDTPEAIQLKFFALVGLFKY